MTNIRFPDITHYRDIETLHLYDERLEEGYRPEEIMASIYARSRDNARTPMQWDDSPNAGFTEGTPWIEVNPNYREINAAAETKNPESVFCFYKRLISLRKQYPVFVDGRFQLLMPDHRQIFAYTRENDSSELLVFANFTDRPAEGLLPEKWRDGRVLLHNCEGTQEWKQGRLQPYEAVLVMKEKK